MRKFNCPHCSAEVLTDRKEGRKEKCRKCEADIKIPSETEEASENEVLLWRRSSLPSKYDAKILAAVLFLSVVSFLPGVSGISTFLIVVLAIGREPKKGQSRIVLPTA